MLPRPTAAAFDSPDHLFEPSWGGRRALAFIEPADAATGLRLLDRRGRDLAPRLPELASLATAVAEPPAVLDGEIVIPGPTGRADPLALAARLGPGARRRLVPGALYLVFDLLYLGGRPLVGLPLARRRDLLARAVRPGPELVVVPALVGAGRDLFQATVAQGLPGLLARHLHSPYLAGRRSSLWRSIDAVAGGLTDESVDEGAEQDRETSARPVLALLQRLPLDFG